jgi:hypothetical protein
MSKKWNPASAKTAAGAAVVWECSVCGKQLTQDDMKASAKHSRDIDTPLDTV